MKCDHKYKVLAVDIGHNNFTVVLGIYVYSEDNYSGDDRDQWEDLRFKTLNLTFSYVKKIDQDTAVSWNQELDAINGSNVRVTGADLNFKFKIDQNWTEAAPNSHFRVYINDRKYDAEKLIDYVYSPDFQEASIGGFDIVSKILPYESFNLTIQVFLAEDFSLDHNITISITDVYLYISYTETFADMFFGPNFSGIFIITFMVIVASILSTLVMRNKYIKGAKQTSLEKLSFTAGYPNVVRPDNWYSLFFYLHLPKFQKNVRKLLDEKSHQQGIHPAISTADSFNLIERGTRLKIIPRVKGITFNPEEQEIAWYEDIQEVIFRFRLGSDMLDRSLIGSIDIFQGALLIGQLAISVKVSLAKEVIEMVMENSKIFEKLFISYSHKDALIVRQCIFAYKALGMKVYIDKNSLRSGEKWRKRLLRLIEQSDVFQLYWSKASRESVNVKKEWQHALYLVSQKGEKFIRPCYWEIPMPDPPKDLESFHFEQLDIEKFKKLSVSQEIPKLKRLKTDEKTK